MPAPAFRVNTPPRPRGFWSTGELRRVFGCDVKTVARLIDAGHLPGFRLGSGRRAVRHEALIAFLRSREEYRQLIPLAERLGGAGAELPERRAR